MDVLVSTRGFLPFDLARISEIPPQLGVEILYENASEGLWASILEPFFASRSAACTVRGPAQGIDLSDRACNFARVMDHYQRAFEFCREYSALHCVTQPYGAFDSYGSEQRSSRQDRCAERLARLSECATEVGVRLLVENMCHSIPLFDENEHVALVKRLPNVGAAVNVGRALYAWWDIPRLLQELGEWAGSVQISDNDGPGSARTCLKLGDGILDVTQVLSAYQQHCPQAVAVLEYDQVSIRALAEDAALLKNAIESAGHR